MEVWREDGKEEESQPARGCGEVRKAEQLKNMELTEHDIIYALCRDNSRSEYN